MDSAHALKLTRDVIQNDPSRSGPLLILLGTIANARGDPLDEAVARDVMLYLYSQLDHCEESMRCFIAQQEPDQARLVA